MTDYRMNVSGVLAVMPAERDQAMTVRFRTDGNDVLTLDLPPAALAALTAGLLSPPIGVSFYPSILRALADGIEAFAGSSPRAPPPR